jgi:5-formyltetrahydrofolate cyclo-ligase
MDDTERDALRARMRTARRALEPRTRLAAADAVAHALRAAFPALQSDARVAGYWANDGELGLHPLLLGRPPIRYHLPVLEPGRRLRFVEWRSGDPLVQNRFGIPEPAAGERLPGEALDLVLCPLLAFDHGGHRLGTGGGYYDRSFAFLAGVARPSRPLLVGVGYAVQEVATLESADWDIDLDAVATEEGFRWCRPPTG